jgi:hypothetical protein
MRTSLRSLWFSLVVVVILASGVPGRAAEPRLLEQGLLEWTPGSCNAVALIHMRKLVESPIGRKEKWGEKVRRAYAEGLLSAPPWVKEVVRATSFGTAGTPITYSIYSMDQVSVIGDIAKHELASIEKITGQFAVLSPRGVYFVQLASGLVGTVQPPDRRAVSAWVRSHAAGKGTELAPYLQSALAHGDTASIVIAVDLTDMLNQERVRGWLATSPRLRALAKRDELAALVASIRGARISLTVTDTIDGRLRLDFDSPVGSQAEALKAVVLQWLEDAGAQMGVLAKAKATSAGKSLTFETALEERALQRILSLIRSPHLPGKGENENAADLKPNAVASAAYYDSVCQLLKSLIRRNKGASDYDKTALWHETFARKIAELPTTGVDGELVNWGQGISDKLRGLAASLRGIPVEVNKLENSIRVNSTTYNRWYANSAESGPLYFPDWIKTESNVDDVRARQADVIAQNADQREAIWTMMKEATAEVARRMQYTYGIKLKLPQ